MSQQSGGWTGPTVEYPHYGLNIDGKNFALARRWLEPCQVPQHGWTRDGKKALIYFRDPSGNLLEIYCSGDFPAASTFPRGVKQGGSYKTDYASLYYDWRG